MTPLRRGSRSFRSVSGARNRRAPRRSAALATSPADGGATLTTRSASTRLSTSSCARLCVGVVRERRPSCPRLARPRPRGRAPSASTRLRHQRNASLLPRVSRGTPILTARDHYPSAATTPRVTGFAPRLRTVHRSSLTIVLETSGLPLPGRRRCRCWRARIARPLLDRGGGRRRGACRDHRRQHRLLARAETGSRIPATVAVVRAVQRRVLPPTERFFRRHGAKAIFFGAFSAFASPAPGSRASRACRGGGSSSGMRQAGSSGR